MDTNKARLYVEGSSRSLDDLAKTYEKIENVPAWAARPEAEERSVKDPLGLSKKKKAPTDPYADGKEAAVRITKFIALCARELELSPEQTIFAVELTALNTINAKDCPLEAGKISEVRDEAFAYYESALKKIPDPK